MDLVKLYQQIKESCQSIDQKMDLLREDIRKLSNAENSPASKLEDTVLDYLDVAQVLHISTRQLRRLHNSGSRPADGATTSLPRCRPICVNFDRTNNFNTERLWQNKSSTN